MHRLWLMWLDWFDETKFGQWWDEHIVEPWTESKRKGELDPRHVPMVRRRHETGPMMADVIMVTPRVGYLVSGGGFCNPSQEAIDLVDRLCAEAGLNKPSEHHCGCGWFMELPTAIAVLMDAGFASEAELMLRRCIAKNDCMEANKFVWKLQEPPYA